ncbi:MAG: septum formation protein [Paraglaciecola sp.]|jgi:septum formation protein
MKLILASTSVYRQTILQKLLIPFVLASPEVDETPLAAESPHDLVARLALAKAKNVATTHNGLIIGSDQVACFNGTILGKPGNFDNAVQQLTFLAGKTVTFYTGLCVYESASKKYENIVELFNVTFKPLNHAQIVTYVNAEQPYDCAGSFKCEGLGICLFTKLDGRDPNTLIGLPLIGLIELLEKFEVDVFDHIDSELAY